MHRKTRRPAHCAPGSITDARQLGERLHVSRERLAASELATIGRAWRLWAACVDATVGYSRAADQTYAGTLATAAGIDRWAASDLLRQFDELEVFVWKAAPRGSRAISELELPSLHMRRPDHMKESHVAPRPHEGTSTCGAHASLQQYVKSSESHRSIGTAIETENVDAEIGTPSFDAMLEGMTIEELERGAFEYAPTIAAHYADELKRRMRGEA